MNLTVLSTISFSAVLQGKEANEKVSGASMVRINEHTGNIQYVLLNETTRILESDALVFIKKTYGTESSYSYRLLAKDVDEIGFTHYRYQQTFNGNDVLGAVIIAHCKNGYLHSFNGEYFSILDKNQTSLLDEKVCLDIALDSTGAESYLWQHEEEEESIRLIKEDPKASWFPKGTLVYVPKGLNFESTEFFLCYRFNIHAFQPRTAENIYVSVMNGNVIARENMLHTTDVPGKAHTKYSGVKNIITDSTAPFNYRLRENTRGNGVYTFNMKKGTSYGAAVDFTDSNNVWNNVNANKDEVATDCHWGAETTYDYYKNIHNRNSYNNNNARINSFVHYANNYDNAFWDGVRMTYGDGNVFKPLTCIDVCGHEITHAVTSNSANLIYSYESGQLNESFSDIFGNAIERYGKPSSYSWKIGEEITNDGSGLRNMFNPKLKGHPRCYKSTNWYFGTGDNGGVHLNSGVQNWWFYLVTEGGTGTNDVSNVYNVDSLGILKAEKIAYRNLTVYLTPTSQYADARFYSIRAAVDLYGDCSKEVIAVTNAWYACNVGPKYDSGFVKADFTADTVICNSSKSVKFTNLSTNAISSKWYFGDGDTSITFSPNHLYSSYGDFTIKLVVRSCFKNNKDSMVKVSYVKIDSTFDICNSVLMPLTGIDSTHKCESFVYDDGGEDIYAQSRKTHLRISVPGADSIRITFSDFDYELNYDSLYIYRGIFPGPGIKVGGYTGSVLPNGGNSIIVPGNVVTLRHISDPYVVGRGFKLFYKAIRKPIDVKAYSDTSICKGTSVILHAKGAGSYSSDYRFNWKGIALNDSITVSPDSSSNYIVYLTDACSKDKDSASVRVTVLEPLELSLSNDTTICSGTATNLMATGKGGRTNSYQFIWDNGLGNGSTKNISPGNTVTYRVIFSDACTPVNDTGYVKVSVLNPLKVKISSNDTDICYNKISMLDAVGSGGDSMNYNYMWNNGLGPGKNKMAILQNSAWLKVSLSDNCSNGTATDSIWVNVRPALSMSLNNDTTLCNGRSTTLKALVNGGKQDDYSFQWNEAVPDTAQYTVKPNERKTYRLTVSDNCSDAVFDSVVVDLYGPIIVSGLSDTTICVGQEVPLEPVVSGGLGSYTFSWNFGLGSNKDQLVSPTGSTAYRVIVSDGCTVLGDTGFANISVRGPLTVKINTVDTLLCYNRTGNYSVSGNGGMPADYVYTWNNLPDTGMSKSYLLTDSAWIKVKLEDGCTVSPGLDSVFVAVRPELKVELNNDTLICMGTDVDVVSLVTGGDVNSYIYNWTGGLPGTANHKIKPVNLVKYKLIVQDNCSDDASDSITIDVRPELRLKGLRDTTLCFGGTATLLPVLSGGVSSQYDFTWNNGLSKNQNLNVSPTVTTVYKLVAKDNCTVPYDSASVTVTVLPEMKMSAVMSKDSICFGDSSLINLTFEGGKTAQYEWFIDGVLSTSTSIKIAPQNTTQYQVILTDYCSEPVEIQLPIVVNQLPIVDFSIQEPEMCIPAKPVFSNLSSGASVYEWNFGNGELSGDFEPNYTFKVAGTYDISLKAESDKGCLNSIMKPAFFKVVERPRANFFFSPQNPDFLNSKVTFGNRSTDFETFEWDFGDNNKDITNESPIHTYGDTGRYSSRLIVSNYLGCKDTMDQVVRVKDVFRIFVPNALTVNYDNINDSFIIKGRGILYYKLEVYNRWGEMMYEGDSEGKPFDGRDPKGDPLMKGSYMINLTVRDFDGMMHYIRQMIDVL